MKPLWILALSLMIVGCGSSEETPTISRARLLNAAGLKALQKGDLEGALIDFSDALSAAEQRDDELEKAHALNNLGQVTEERGDHEQAEKYYRQALEVNRRHDDTEPWQITNLINIGGVLFLQGRFVDARATFDEALDQATVLEDDWRRALAINGLAFVDRKEGHLDRAYQRFSEAGILFEEAGDKNGQGSTQLGLGILLEERGLLKEAIHRFSLARNAHQEKGRPDGIARSLEALARCYEKLGEPENALVWLERALGVNLNIPRLDHARTNLQEMRRLHEKLGNAHDVEMIDARLAEIDAREAEDNG